jgi:hypothetical protein
VALNQIVPAPSGTNGLTRRLVLLLLMHAALINSITDSPLDLAAPAVYEDYHA